MGSGNTAAARSVVNQLVDLSTRLYVAPFDWAIVHAGLGEIDKALERLSEAWHEQIEALVSLEGRPLFRPLTTTLDSSAPPSDGPPGDRRRGLTAVNCLSNHGHHAVRLTSASGLCSSDFTGVA